MLDQSEQQIVDDVAEHGFHSMGVGEGDGEPSFRYSIGFWETLRSPEVLTFGLPFGLMHDMLWEMFRQIKGGARLVDGARFANVLDGCDCIVRPIHRTQIDHLGFAMWYHGHRGLDPRELRAFQLFWPGKKQGLFPWDRGCAKGVKDSQPLLYLPRKTGVA